MLSNGKSDRRLPWPASALVHSSCPLVRDLLATLGLSFAVVIGLVEELRAAMRH